MKAKFRIKNNKITGIYVTGSANIPNGVTSIEAYAFSHCENLTSIIIPDSVTSIGTEAFSYCKNLTSITIGNGVTNIGRRAFVRCSSIKNIMIPDNVTSIGVMAFFDIKSVQVSTGNPVFSVDKRGVLINKKEKKLLYTPPSLSGNYTIPDSVTSIEEWAFSERHLTNITLGNSIMSIGFGAFYGCKNLISVTIPDNVTSIEQWAFHGCRALTSIVIPKHFTDEDVKKWGIPDTCKIIRRN